MIAIILGVVIAIVALFSLVFTVYPYFFLEHAPKVVRGILTVINFVVPITGIITMFTFIYRRERR